jgi:hypothetical protein
MFIPNRYSSSSSSCPGDQYEFENDRFCSMPAARNVIFWLTGLFP